MIDSHRGDVTFAQAKLTLGSGLRALKEFKRALPTVGLSGLLGFFVGVLPAAGATPASLTPVGYRGQDPPSATSAAPQILLEPDALVRDVIADDRSHVGTSPEAHRQRARRAEVDRPGLHDRLDASSLTEKTRVDPTYPCGG